GGGAGGGLDGRRRAPGKRRPEVARPGGPGSSGGTAVPMGAGGGRGDGCAAGLGDPSRRAGPGTGAGRLPVDRERRPLVGLSGSGRDMTMTDEIAKFEPPTRILMGPGP